MKKFITVLLIIFLFVLVSCGQDNLTDSNQESTSNVIYSTDEIKQKCEDYVYCLTLALSYEWDDNADSDMYNNSNSMYFKSVLQSLYKYEYGVEMNNIDGYIKIDDYIQICEKFFPIKVEEAKKLIRASGVYDNLTDSITMTEGIGSIKLAQIDNIIIDNNIVNVYYLIGDETYDENLNKYVPGNPLMGTITMKIDENNNYVFLSNIVE